MVPELTRPKVWSASRDELLMMQWPLQPRQYGGLHVEAVARQWQVHAQASAGGPTPSICRVRDAGDCAVSGGVVVTRAVVMQRAHHLRRAPRLVDADIASDIWHKQTRIIPRTVGRTAGGEDRKDRAKTCDHASRRCRVEIFDRPGVERPVFDPETRAPAVPKLGGIVECVDAEAAEVLIGEIGLQAIARGVEKIENRDCLAGGEAGELDEGAGKVDYWRHSASPRPWPRRLPSGLPCREG